MDSKETLPPILALPYENRSKLVVLSDAEVAAYAQQKDGNYTENEDLEQFNENIRKRVSNLILRLDLNPTANEVSLKSFDFTLAVLRYGTGIPSTAYKVSRILHYFSILRKWRPNEAPFLGISLSRSRDLIFTPAHPQKRILYIGNPVDDKYYYPVADFHVQVMIHKAKEAIRILRSLGAIRIIINQDEENLREQTGNISMSLAEAGKVGAKLSTAKLEARNVLFSCSYHPLPPEVERRLPSNLLWYPHEVAWHVIEPSLNEVSIAIKNASDFGVNSELVAKAGAYNLELGGKFVKHQSAGWSIEASFT